MLRRENARATRTNPCKDAYRKDVYAAKSFLSVPKYCFFSAGVWYAP